MTLRGKSAWVTILVLVISLCVNSFFVGAVVMRALDPAGQRPPGGQRGELVQTAGLARVLAGLPSSIHDHLRGSFEATGEVIPSMHRDLRQARRDVLRALRTDPLDIAALDAALASTRIRTTALQETLHQIFVDAMEDMPPEMRAQAVEIWGDRR